MQWTGLSVFKFHLTIFIDIFYLEFFAFLMQTVK